jgi:hypothetical protein
LFESFDHNGGANERLMAVFVGDRAFDGLGGRLCESENREETSEEEGGYGFHYRWFSFDKDRPIFRGRMTYMSLSLTEMK